MSCQFNLIPSVVATWFVDHFSKCHKVVLGISFLALYSLHSFLSFSDHCPRSDFAQKAKSRGGTLVTRAYIKESIYS